MRKFLKWTAIMLASWVGVLGLALALIYAVNIVRLNHKYEIAGTPFTLSSDTDTLVEGKRKNITQPATATSPP